VVTSDNGLNQSVTCLCILAPENLLYMATNRCVSLFYTLLLKLKLVGHFTFNMPEIFTKASFIILLKTSGFHFWISTPDVELCGGKVACVCCGLQSQSLSPQSSTSEVDTQNGNCSFLLKLSKKVW